MTVAPSAEQLNGSASHTPLPTPQRRTIVGSVLSRPPARPHDELPITRLVLRYLATGLVTLMVVAVATAYVSRRLGTQEAIDDADRVTEIVAATAIEPVLTEGILTLDPEAIRRLDWSVRHQVLRGSLVRVKLWDRNGTILYSDESRLIGQQFELEQDKIDVLAGGDGHAEESDLSLPENRFEEPALKLLEVYQLVESPEGNPLLFEAYFKYDGVDDAGRRAWLRFAPVTLGALVLLELLQVPVAISLARRLRRTQRQREELLRNAIDSADAERRRIAADLHDGVVQDLAGAAFSLGAAARTLDRPASLEVRAASELVRDSVRSLRSLLVEIYPPNLYEEGLESALSDLLAKLAPRDIATTLAFDIDDLVLPMDTTQLIYRATQEGIRNVVTHAGASRVDVVVEALGDVVVARVIDDGSGMDIVGTEPKAGHVGLKTLAGIAETMGAVLSVESTRGVGTELRLEIPIR